LSVNLHFYSQETTIPAKLEFQQLNEGLSENNIKCILQDHQGYIWAGTHNGLNRYDGIKFEIFEHNINDNTSIPSNRIKDIFEDSRQNLWLGTASGLARYNRENNNFDRWPYQNDSIESSNKNMILSIEEDSEKNLWLGTGCGIRKFNPKTGKFKFYLIEALDIAQEENYVHTINFDNKERLWIGTGSGIFLFDINKEQFIDLKSENGSSLGPLDVRDIHEDVKGQIWLGTRNNGLFKLTELSEGVFGITNFVHDENDRHSLSKNVIVKILEDHKHRLWIGTENGGLCLYDALSNKFYAYTHDPTDGTSLKSNSIKDLFEDKQGRLWVGTNNSGINLFDPYHRKFFHERRSPSQTDGLKHNGVTSFLEYENELWIGTDGGGITLWDKEINSYRYFEHDPKDIQSIGSNSVLSIFRDSEGIIWAGTWAGGLNRYDPNLGKFKRYINEPKDPHSISSNSIFSISEDKSGNIWLTASGKGICRLDKKTGKFLRIGSDANDPNSLSIEFVYDIHVDRDERIWVTSEEGLNRVIINADDSYQVTQFHESVEDSTTLSSKRTRFVFEDSKGRIWIGTNGGLNLYISDEKGFEVFTKYNGLPSNAIRGMAEDESGDYWITTVKGISKMTEPEDGSFHFRNYDKSDGLQGDEYIMSASYINKKGEIFLGGTNGLNYFDPARLKDNPYKPNVLFTSFKLFNKEVGIGVNNSPLLKDISVTKEIILNHDQSVFSLDFIALNLTHSEKNQYAYMLEGFEKEWNYVGGKRSATYTNLDAGGYIFKVKAANNDGLWNEEGASLKITVLPPWWETWWARTTLLLIVVGAAIGYYRYKTYKLKKNQEVLENLVEERTSEVKMQAKELQQRAEEIESINQKLEENVIKKTSDLIKSNKELDNLVYRISHDIRAPLSSVLGLVGLMREEQDSGILNHYFDLIIKSVNKLDTFVRDILDYSMNSRLEVHKIEFNARELINSTWEELQFMDNADKLHIITEVSNKDSVLNDKKRLYIIFKNLISNAIKYQDFKSDKSSFLKITINHSEVDTIIRIEDNGIGIPKKHIDKVFDMFYRVSESSKGSGIGLYIVKETVEKLEGKITLESEKGKGSIFDIRLPNI